VGARLYICPLSTHDFKKLPNLLVCERRRGASCSSDVLLRRSTGS
jgi:hypothetical protein